MKRTVIQVFCLSAAVLLLGACAEKGGPEVSGSAGDGLLKFSATLDNATRTSLRDDYAVNWTAGDRIALVNTATNAIYTSCRRGPGPTPASSPSWRPLPALTHRQ